MAGQDAAFLVDDMLRKGPGRLGNSILKRVAEEEGE